MYEKDEGAVTEALQSSSSTVFTADTIAKILALTTTTNSSNVSFDTVTPDVLGNITVAAGTEVVFITSSDTQQTIVTPPANTPVVIFQGEGGVAATMDDGPTTVPASAAGIVDRVVIGSAGNDKIVVADAKNSHITLGTGNSTVVAGAGADTIVAGSGNSTVSGGTGHAIVELKGNAADYIVTVDNGHAVVTHAGDAITTDITKIQFVQLDDGKALVFAKDTQQAAITTLYETTFGRTADANGLKHWFDKAAAGESLAQIAVDFTQSDEFKAQAASTNADFVEGLYQNTFSRAAETAGLDFWTNALNNGATRAQLITTFSDIASHNIDGTMQTEAIIVGSVTIVHDII